MKKKWKIILGILLVLFLIIFYMGYTFYNNLKGVNELDLEDCSKSFETEYCLYSNLVECVPATNYNGFNILGWRKNKCKTMIKISDEEMFFCYFSENSLEKLKSWDKVEIEDKLVNFILNLKENQECEQVGYSSIFFRNYWD